MQADEAKKVNLGWRQTGLVAKCHRRRKLMEDCNDHAGKQVATMKQKFGFHGNLCWILISCSWGLWSNSCYLFFFLLSAYICDWEVFPCLFSLLWNITLVDSMHIPVVLMPAVVIISSPRSKSRVYVQNNESMNNSSRYWSSDSWRSWGTSEGARLCWAVSVSRSFGEHISKLRETRSAWPSYINFSVLSREKFPLPGAPPVRITAKGRYHWGLH